MKFRDLDSGDRFIFEDSINDGRDSHGIFCFIKLNKPVICQISARQMSENVSKKSEMRRLIDILTNGIDIKPYTAVTEHGVLIWVPDNAEVLKLFK